MPVEEAEEENGVDGIEVVGLEDVPEGVRDVDDERAFMGVVFAFAACIEVVKRRRVRTVVRRAILS